MNSETNQERGKPFLKSLRELLGVSQEEFARRIGVAVITISRWERGVALPSFTVPQMKAFIQQLHLAGLEVDEIPDDFTQPIHLTHRNNPK